ncbi:metallophosphoesterase [Salinicoccus sesuvii]|uniref:Metallophosphoesterase n=1 Tax=Salinicoccus sesuvii TaxID=868281 RepID=A0ABV7N1B2_9STAP
MKIGIIADLHIDRTKTEYTIEDFKRVLACEMLARNLDLLLIAGDISNDCQVTSEFVWSLMTATNIDVRFVPGNHDYWQPENMTSSQVYQFYKDHPQSLVESPLVLNDDWAIVGHSGWYDYSYADPRFPLEKLASGKFYGGTWQDKVRIDWPVGDSELSRTFAKTVQKDLETVKGLNTILMTHVVTHHKFVVPTPHRLFDFYNAYIGTSDFDSFYKDYPIRYSIMGHVHFRHRLEADGIQYVCPCLGYQREWRTNDLATEVRNTLEVIEI